jgi:iron complex outermembrane recepter protein
VAGLFYRDMTVPDRQDIYTDGSGVTEPGLPADLVFGGLTTEKIREDAGFGEASYRWGMAELTAGGRLYHISTQVVFAGDGLFNGGPSISGAASSESGFSPKLEVTLKPTPTNLVYALADKGFRPGGGNTAIPTACAADLAALGLSAMPLQFHSDSLWNYEVGSKNTLLGGILTLNGSLFYMDWSHIQQSVALPTCGFGFTGNVGAAVSKGGEFDIDSHFGGLTLHGGIVYDNAYVTQTAPGTAAQLGDPIEQAPKVTASTAVDYVFPLRSGVRGTLHLDYAYHGSQAQSFNKSYLSNIDPLSGAPLGGVMTVADPSYLQPHYELASGSVGVLVGSWNVRFIVQNLFNARPLLGLMSTGSLANNAFSLAPRTFTLAAHVDF